MTSAASAAPSSSHGAVGEVRPSTPEQSGATLGELYDRYGSTAYSLALSITNDRPAAERIVTAAFATTWQNSARDAGTASAKSFFSSLMTTVRTKAVVARTARSTPVSFDRPNGHQPPNSLGMAVATALRDLPEAQQHVLALAYFGGLGLGDIASELREPVSHVKVNLYAALGHLRSVLAEPRGMGGAQ